MALGVACSDYAMITGAALSGCNSSNAAGVIRRSGFDHNDEPVHEAAGQAAIAFASPSKR